MATMRPEFAFSIPAALNGAGGVGVELPVADVVAEPVVGVEDAGGVVAEVSTGGEAVAVSVEGAVGAEEAGGVLVSLGMVLVLVSVGGTGVASVLVGGMTAGVVADDSTTGGVEAGDVSTTEEVLTTVVSTVADDVVVTTAGGRVSVVVAGGGGEDVPQLVTVTVSVMVETASAT